MKVIVSNSNSILLIYWIQLIYSIRYIISKNWSSRKRMQYEYQIIAAEEDIIQFLETIYTDKDHLFYVLLKSDIN